jgi:hypothetical protein
MRARIAGRLAFAISTLAFGGCDRDAVAPEPLPERVVGVPPGWLGGVGPSKFYEIGLYRLEKHSGHSAVYLDGPPLTNTESAIISQGIRADNWRGKRVRFSAWVKSQDLNGPIAGLWMRVDGPGVVTGYDNMSDRPVSGTAPWHEVSIVLDVPSDAIGIALGAILQGGGPVNSGFMVIDDMRFEVVDKNAVASTNQYDAPRVSVVSEAATIAAYANAATRPANLDFERIP